MPAFSGKAIKAYIPTIVSCKFNERVNPANIESATYKCLKSWEHYKPGDDVDFSSWMTKVRL